jgi:hypothetical protein
MQAGGYYQAQKHNVHLLPGVNAAAAAAAAAANDAEDIYVLLSNRHQQQIGLTCCLKSLKRVSLRTLKVLLGGSWS